MVDGGFDLAVGGHRVTGVDLLLDQQRADQRQGGDPGQRQAGDREPEAPLLAVALGDGPALGQLTAAGGDEGAGGEEEDRPDRGNLPEPVNPRADREGEAGGEQRGVQLPPRTAGGPPG